MSDDRITGPEQPRSSGPDNDAPDEGAEAPEVPTHGDVAATFCATLLDEWVGLGVAHAVIAPGSRSTPIALALDAAPGIELHVAHDERGAAFMALGIARATGRPGVVASTSGTAAVNFHPAVVEADLAAVPMLVVTADRPPELQGVLAPQTIDQRELFGSAVRWYCEPGPPAQAGSSWWRDLAADAHERATGVLPGPVHLDLAFRDPLLGTAGELPPPRLSSDAVASDAGRAPGGLPWGLADEDAARIAAALSGRRGVIVAGARSSGSAGETAAVMDLADALCWPVLADGPSGLRLPWPGVITTFDHLLRHDHFAGAPPEAVIRLGGLLSSKVTGAWLAAATGPQYGVDRHGRCPDPDRVLVRSLWAEPADVAEALLRADPAPAPPQWRSSWEAAEQQARDAMESTMMRMGAGPATEPAVALDVAALVPEGGSVVVSSSMPVRDLESFAAAREGVHFHANRGANGIDGVTATAIGVALANRASGVPTVLLTGDVAFLHDASSLTALARRSVDLVIVVVDNDGGGIFHFLPQGEHLAQARFERLFGTPHGTDLTALATAFGLPVQKVGSRAGLQAALSGALSRRGPRVVVVETDRRANVAVHRRISAAVGEALTPDEAQRDRPR